MVDALGFGASPSQFYVEPAGDYREGLIGLGGALGQFRQETEAKTAAEQAAAKEDALKAEAARLYREGTSEDIRQFTASNPEWGQIVMEQSSLRDQENALALTNTFYAAKDDPTKISQLLDAYEARLKLNGLTDQEAQEIAEAREKSATDPEGFLKSMEISVAPLDFDRYDRWVASQAEPEVDLTTTQKEYKTAQDQGYKGSFMDYQRETNPTTAIQEYEYGVENPDYVLGQREEEAAAADAAAQSASYGSETALRKEFLAQASDYQTVRDSYTRVLKSTEDPTPAGDLSLIFNYMKMLDPGSVVRESEFQTAASAGSYGERVKASVDMVLSGKRLTDSMRADFLNKSESLFNGMEDQHAKREDTYRGIAVNNGLNPNTVVTDIRRAITDTKTQGDEGKTVDEMSYDEMISELTGGL